MSTATFVRRYADAALEACWLILAALLPLYFDLLRSQPATPKELLCQLVVAAMAALWLV
jgi:hypothetical protein